MKIIIHPQKHLKLEKLKTKIVIVYMKARKMS